MVTSVCCGYPTLAWPCRDALLELLYPLYLRATGAEAREPSLLLKRAVALLIVLVASAVAWCGRKHLSLSYNPPHTHTQSHTVTHNITGVIVSTAG